MHYHLLLDCSCLPIAVHIWLEVGLLLLLLLIASARWWVALEEFAVQQGLQLSMLWQIAIELSLGCCCCRRLVVALGRLLLWSLTAPVARVVLWLLLHKVS